MFHRTDESYYPFVVEYEAADPNYPDVWTHGLRFTVRFAPTGTAFPFTPNDNGRDDWSQYRAHARKLLLDYYAFRSTRAKCRD